MRWTAVEPGDNHRRWRLKSLYDEIWCAKSEYGRLHRQVTGTAYQSVSLAFDIADFLQNQTEKHTGEVCIHGFVNALPPVTAALLVLFHVVHIRADAADAPVPRRWRQARYRGNRRKQVWPNRGPLRQIVSVRAAI